MTTEISAPDSVTLESADQTKLYGVVNRAAAARGGALIVHGYCEHGGRYEHVAQTAVDVGLTTLRIDLRGHGRSDGSRGKVTKFEDYVSDIEAGLNFLKQELGDHAPLAILAHSNGALAALRLIADPFRCPETLQCAVLSSPFLGFATAPPKAKAMVGGLASRWMPSLALKAPIEAEILTHDPEMVRARKFDTLCHDVASARWFTEAQETHRWVATFADRITLPSLWLLAGDDRLVSLESTQAVISTLTADHKVHVYPGFFHEVWNEVHREQPLGATREWLETYFPTS